MIRMMLCVVLAVTGTSTIQLAAQDDAFPPPHQTALGEVDRRADQIKQINRLIWEYAEIGLQERKSAALLVEHLT